MSETEEALGFEFTSMSGVKGERRGGEGSEEDVPQRKRWARGPTPPCESTEKGSRMMLLSRSSWETDEADDATPAELEAVLPSNLASSAVRSAERAVSAVSSALRTVEGLALTTATLRARQL